MKYDFDRKHERYGTASVKWDLADKIFGEEELLPLWVADMDFPSPEPVVKAIIDRAWHGIFGYSAYTDSYYDATVRWLRDTHGWAVEPRWIVGVSGVVPAINMIIHQFSSEGDGIIMQQPVYHPFMSAVSENERKILNNQLVYENGEYSINFEEFEEMASLPYASMFILCSPHNPVGRVWTETELRRLGKICLKHDVLMVSDEIHSDLVFRGRRHIPLASISSELAERTITCHAPSKTFNIPGLHSAYLIISSATLRREFKKRLAMNGISGPDIFGPVAQEAAYNYGRDWLEQVMEYIEDNYLFVKDFLKREMPDVLLVEPEATYLLWLDFRAFGLTVDELRNKLRREAHLALNEGDLFGKGGEGFVRMNIACPRSILEEALRRLKNIFNK